MRLPYINIRRAKTERKLSVNGVKLLSTMSFSSLAAKSVSSRTAHGMWARKTISTYIHIFPGTHALYNFPSKPPNSLAEAHPDVDDTVIHSVLFTSMSEDRTCLESVQLCMLSIHHTHMFYLSRRLRAMSHSSHSATRFGCS